MSPHRGQGARLLGVGLLLDELVQLVAFKGHVHNASGEPAGWRATPPLFGDQLDEVADAMDAAVAKSRKAATQPRPSGQVIELPGPS